jgi:isopentenyl diphosphate isomerase/L-lactate dehydrogenase-like FMN-dependent dehydrogenase
MLCSTGRQMLNPFRASLDRVVNIDDLRRLARRRAPDAIFDYIDGGADGEVTLQENRRSWNDVLFRPRNAVRVPGCDTTTEVLGATLSMPLLLAPVGYSRIFHPDGEVGVARAAKEAGIGYVLSTFAGYKVETVAAAAGPLWYQLYLAGGRSVAEAALARAWASGCRVLAVTIDTNAPGWRERDLRNRSAQLIGKGLFNKLPFVPHLLRHPRWLAGYIGDWKDVMFYPNVVVPGSGPMRARDVRGNLITSTLAWDDLLWIRKAWPGAFVMKGVLTGDDARRAVDEGAAGVIVSNHGGRQLDTCFPTARALPEVVRAVQGRAEVLVDGGIRRGADIAKAVAMGAKAVLVGRAYAYGLAGAGQPGVARAIAILRADLERTLALLGCPASRSLDGSYVEVPKHW